MPANDNAVLVSLNDVCEMSSLSRTYLNKLRDQGKFPKAVLLGDKRIAFVRTEVLEWLQARIDARAA